jgi:hypothetical protein
VRGWVRGGCVVPLGCQRIDGSMHERVVESLTMLIDCNLMQWVRTKEHSCRQDSWDCFRFVQSYVWFVWFVRFVCEFGLCECRAVIVSH